MVRDHLDYRIPIDFGEPCRADRADEVVYRPEQEGVQAEEIAGDEKGQDLSPAVRQEAVTAGHPVGNNESRAHRVAFGQDVHATLEALLTRTQRLEHADVLIRQRCKLQQLRHKRVLCPLFVACDVALDSALKLSRSERRSSLRAQRSNLVDNAATWLEIAASPYGLLAMTGSYSNRGTSEPGH